MRDKLLAVGVALALLLFGFGMYATQANQKRRNARLERLQKERDSLAAELEAVKARCPEAPKPKPERVMRSLAVDMDVAHARIDDLLVALDAVARTTPGRARAPEIPKRARPSPSASNLLGERARPESPVSTGVSGVVK